MKKAKITTARGLARVISREYGPKYEVTIIENEGSRALIGCCVQTFCYEDMAELPECIAQIETGDGTEKNIIKEIKQELLGPLDKVDSTILSQELCGEYRIDFV